MVHDQFRRWFLPGAVLVVALVIVGGDLAAWWFFGWPDVFATLVMNGAVAIGTLTLAVVAWIENQNTVRQMEIDRAKPGVLTLIAYWLDGLYTALDGDRDRFTEQDGDDPIAFHQFGPITDPFLEAPIDDNELPDRIVQEISEAYPSLPNHIERYDQTAAEYRERRNDVKQALEEYFQHEFVDYLEPEQVQTEIQQYLNDEGMGDYTPEEYLANNLNSFAHTVLYGNTAAGSYTEGYWENVPETPIDIRSKDQFADAFADLEEQYRTLRDLNTQMINRLDDARSQFKDRYDIVESEVVERTSRISQY